MTNHVHQVASASTAKRPSAEALSPADAAVHRRQFAHSLVMWGLPTIGTIGAVVLWIQQGFPVWPVVLAAVMFSLTMVGVSVGFHRLYSHRSFEATAAARAILAILGSMAFQGPLVYWVANHRRHHCFSDREGDLHSPHVGAAGGRWTGFLHAHFGWGFTHELTNSIRYAKDLYGDPVALVVNRHYFAWIASGFVVPGLVGFCIRPDVVGAALGVLWGACVRLFLTNNATAAINSVTHLWGKAPFTTADHSVNVPWLALATFGEAWHNNHHRFPSSAIFGLRRGEVDLGGLVVRGMAALGAAKGVQRPSATTIEADLQETDALRRQAARDVEQQGGESAAR